MQRLRETSAFALLGVEDLRQQTLAIGCQPRDLCGAFVGHVPKRDEVVAVHERGSDRAHERNRDHQHEQERWDRGEPDVRPNEHGRRGHQRVHELERKRRQPGLADDAPRAPRAERRVRRRDEPEVQRQEENADGQAPGARMRCRGDPARRRCRATLEHEAADEPEEPEDRHVVEGAPSRQIRLMSASGIVATIPIATAGAGPSSAMPTTCTMRPADTLT